MPTEAQINDLLGQICSHNIDRSLKAAAALDHLEESDAIMFYAVELLQAGMSPMVLAVHAAAMSVRWHRTRQTEAAVNSPEPGPSPESAG